MGPASKDRCYGCAQKKTPLNPSPLGYNLDKKPAVSDDDIAMRRIHSKTRAIQRIATEKWENCTVRLEGKSKKNC